MAISKTQNERPAIIALINAVNMAEPIIAQNVQDIATLTDGLDNEISNRESADTQLQSNIALETSSRTAADTSIQNQLSDEISNRESADTQLQSAITSEVTNRTAADTIIQNQIGEGVFSSDFTITHGFQQSGIVIQNINSAIDDISQWKDRFRLGLTPNVTVAAGGSTSGSFDFESQFGDDAEVAVFPVCVGSSGNFTDLSCKLISADYSGFSFAVNNDTQTSVTTKVGFLAVKVN